MKPSLHAIFCDDIRPEVGNKLSYMGCYTGQMFVPSLPITLPKLCVAMHASTLAEHPFKHVQFRLLKGDEVIAEAEMDMSMVPAPTPPVVIAPGSELKYMVAQVIQLSPFILNEPCVLLARAICDGEELKGGSLSIAAASSSTTNE